MVNTDQHRDAIIGALRAAAGGNLRDEEAAWHAIKQAVEMAGETEQARRLDAYIYELGIIFVRATGALPGYTNGDSETRFERFVHAIPPPVGVCVTRHSVKLATRRLKANPLFQRLSGGPHAAE